jgi:uncharacterized protein (TIGR02598 family)
MSPENPESVRFVWPCRTVVAKRRAGFSLIEVTLAVAIVAFSFIAMLGLLAPGLNNFAAALNTQVSAEIYQRVAADLQDSDFTALINYPAKGTGGQYYSLPLRYFDAQGQEVKIAGTTPTTADRQRIVYTARVRGAFPGAKDVSVSTPNWFTSLPAVSGARFNPRDSVFLTVQVILSQGRDVDAVVDNGTWMIPSDTAAQRGFPLRTYPILVSRNGF